NTKPSHRSSPNANSRETQSGQLARLVHADCRPKVTASWNTVQLLGVPQEGKGQADLLRRLKVFGRKQSLPSSGVPVRAAGTRSRYKVGIYSDYISVGCREARVAWSIRGPPYRDQSSSPLSFASTMACARERTPSFSKIRVT